MKLFNIISTICSIFLCPIWVIGLFIGLLSRGLLFGIIFGYNFLDVWRNNLLLTEQEKEQEEIIRKEAVEQLLRTGNIPTEMINQEKNS